MYRSDNGAFLFGVSPFVSTGQILGSAALDPGDTGASLIISYATSYSGRVNAKWRIPSCATPSGGQSVSSRGTSSGAVASGVVVSPALPTRNEGPNQPYRPVTSLPPPYGPGAAYQRAVARVAPEGPPPAGARIIYAVRNDGTLMTYVDNSSDTAYDWWAGGEEAPALPGVNWAEFTEVFTGGEGVGVIYAIDKEGYLRYFHLLDRFRNGSWSWSPDSNTVIGTGWGDYFQEVFAGGDGILYGITAEEGNLLFYRHSWQWDGRVDPDNWAYEWGQVIGTVWNGFRSVFSSRNGIIYAIDNTGKLLFYQDISRDGHPEWSYEWAQTIASGSWNTYDRTFTGGNGIIYAIDANGDLYRYRDRAQNGSVYWANSGLPVWLGAYWGRPNFKFVFAETVGSYGLEVPDPAPHPRRGATPTSFTD
jgi:hypothetical protein